MTKRCPRCDKILDYSFFGKNKSKLDGLQNYCKKCRRGQAIEGAEKIASYQREYRGKNAQRLSSAARERYLRNPEYFKKKARDWKASNSDRKKFLDREWQRNNKDKVNINCARRRATKQAASSIKYSVDDLLGKLLVWGYRCYLCGKILDDTIQWDHVKPLSAGGPNILANMRPTHGKCNASKGGKWPYINPV